MFGIPTWVIVLFFVLVYIGLNRCFTRVMPLKKLAIAPIIFLIFGLNSINKLFAFNSQTALYLIIGGVLGIYLGYLQVKNKMILADKERGLIQIPGDFLLFASLMIVFVIELFIHYAIDAHWVISDFTFFKLIAIFLSGVVIGLTIGRNSTYFYRYIASNHSPLNLTIN